MMGCWGGVLAAVVCLHTGCETSTPAAGEASATHGDHGTTCGNMVKPEDHSGDVSSHEGHTGELTDGAWQQFRPAGLHTVARVQHEQSCAHCVGRPESPPAPYSEWQSNSVKRGVNFAAPVAAVQVDSPAPVYPRKITPAQHAPPGSSDRHLLLKVFRI